MINLKENKAKQNPFSKKFMSDFCGLIELISLHQLTGDFVYLNTVLEMLEVSKSFVNGTFSSVFYRDVCIALKISTNKRICEKLKEIQMKEPNEGKLELLETNINFKKREKIFSSFIKKAKDFTILNEMNYDTSIIRILAKSDEYDLAKEIAVSALEDDLINANKAVQFATQAAFLDEGFMYEKGLFVFNTYGYLVYIN